MPDIGRHHPSPGVHGDPDQPTVVFLTVHTSGRSRWLANDEVHRCLTEAWKEAGAWAVGHYVLMPDHLHLFCAPVLPGYSIEQWITFWKRSFRRLHGPDSGTFQSRGWHHRLRSGESYAQKWDYVRLNPVRAGLSASADSWPWQGMIHALRWVE